MSWQQAELTGEVTGLGVLRVLEAWGYVDGWHVTDAGVRLARIYHECDLLVAEAIAGGLLHGTIRELLWLLAVGVDLAGSAAGFYVPGLGRSTTRD